MINKTLGLNILEKRKLADAEPKELREKRKKFFSWIMVEHGAAISFNEMYKIDGEVIKTKLDAEQYFNQYWNTREKFPTEFDFEIDDLPKDEAIKVICKVCLSLMKNDVHFCVFYAAGQRSPHIRIYNFNSKIDEELLALDEYKREQAEKTFWKTVVPQYWNYCDGGIWTCEHPLQLEFSLHWKHGTPFELLFEYVPNLKTKQQKLQWK